jgi:UMF1 family MFS transporter
MHEGVRDPFVIMVVIYIFQPYFARVIVGDAVKGQELIAFITTAYGLAVAATAPFLGAVVQNLGRRKPMLLVVIALMVPVIASLWWAKPNGAGLSIFAIAAILMLSNVLFAYAEMLHNAMIVTATTVDERPHASGLGFALGNFVSTFMLAFVLWAFVLPGLVPWAPAHPLFGLDRASHQPDRIVGPIVAVFLAIGSIPMFLFSKDAPSTGLSVLTAFRRGFGSLMVTVKSLGTERNAALYLGSRMLYTDGMTSLLAIGGVYAAGVMHWGVLEMLAYGIGLSIAAVFGGVLGGIMDAKFGPRQSVRIEVAGAIVCLVGQLSMARDHLFFVIPFDPAAHAPLWNGPMFRTLPEVVYLLIGLGTAVFVCSQYASSRTLLTRLVPEDKAASYFGLYALSGTVTAWLGSFLVGVSTHVFKTQQAGFAPIALLLLIGLVGMMFVKGGGVIQPRQ